MTREDHEAPSGRARDGGCQCCDCVCACVPASLLSAARLCYVEGSAWFTTREVKKQWGDDWNDAPYEHNAGRPYDWRPDKWLDGKFVPNDEPRWDLLELGYSGADLETPKDWNYPNSPYSVEAINRGAVPWLSSPRYAAGTTKIFAGVTAREFVDTILGLGGTIWIPRTPAGGAS